MKGINDVIDLFLLRYNDDVDWKIGLQRLLLILPNFVVLTDHTKLVLETRIKKVLNGEE